MWAQVMRQFQQLGVCVHTRVWVAAAPAVTCHPSAQLCTGAVSIAWQNTAHKHNTHFLFPSFPPPHTHTHTYTRTQMHTEFWGCATSAECEWHRNTRTHTLLLHSVPWLTRWFVLFLRPEPIRLEDTNLSPQVMLKATGHYLLAISVLTTQTDRATRLWQEDTTAVSAFVCVFHTLWVNLAMGDKYAS